MNEDAASETVRIIRQENGTANAISADVTSHDDIRRMVKACTDLYGRIDVVDYNVGLAHVGGVVELPEEEWDRIFAVNLKGCFLTMKHVIPIMEKQGGGSIINISFVAGIRPFLARTTCADHIKALPSRSQALLMNLESFRLKIR